MSAINVANPIVKNVEDGMCGGFPITGVNAAFTQATTGVVMNPKPKGAVPLVLFVDVEVVFVVVV
jgi:hypothetical protein